MFEYEVLAVEMNDLQATLTAWGQDGWTIVSVTSTRFVATPKGGLTAVSVLVVLQRPTEAK